MNLREVVSRLADELEGPSVRKEVFIGFGLTLLAPGNLSNDT